MSKKILWIDDNPQKLLESVASIGGRFWDADIRLEFLIMGDSIENEDGTERKYSKKQEDLQEGVIRNFRNYCRQIDNENNKVVGATFKEKKKPLLFDNDINNPDFDVLCKVFKLKENENKDLSELSKISEDDLQKIVDYIDDSFVVLVDAILFKNDRADVVKWKDGDKKPELVSAKLFKALTEKSISVHLYTSFDFVQEFVEKYNMIYKEGTNIEIIPKDELNGKNIEGELNEKEADKKPSIIDEIIAECKKGGGAHAS